MFLMSFVLQKNNIFIDVVNILGHYLLRIANLG